jgi:hypothetical protein
MTNRLADNDIARVRAAARALVDNDAIEGWA